MRQQKSSYSGVGRRGKNEEIVSRKVQGGLLGVGNAMIFNPSASYIDMFGL